MVIAQTRGQVGISLLLVIMGLLLSVATAVDFGDYLAAKIEAQSAADAGALCGTQVMAAMINSCAVYHVGSLLQFTFPFLGKVVGFLAPSVPYLIQYGPRIAEAIALIRASCGGKYLPVPLTELTHPNGPGLDLVYFRILWLGPFILEHHRTSEKFPYGNRLMRLGVVKKGVKLPFLSLLLGKEIKSPMIVAAAEAAVKTDVNWFVKSRKGYIVKPSITSEIIVENLQEKSR